MKTTRSTKGKQAIVLGGGIAGLAAAGVLARHFAQVTLIERDRYAGGPGVRPHTQHGAHAHVLLAGGLLTLSRLVPELPGWLDELGFPEGDLTHHTRVAFEGQWLPRARSGVPIRPCLRPEVEHLLLRDVQARPNITIRDGWRVEGLLGEERVTGVRIARATAVEELSADLVVDAMGRGSPSKKWLQESGLPPVEELSVDAGVVYASGWFTTPHAIDDDWAVIATLPAIPSAPRMGIVVRLGEDRLLCSAVAYGNPRPPRTPADLVAHMDGLCVPELHRLLRAATPASEVSVYGNTQNRLRRFGRLPRFPDGLAIIGDAACSLNPRYGQGMTVASLGAERLDEELSTFYAAHRSLDGFSHHFQKRLEAMLTVPWQMALLEDRTWATAQSGAAPGVGERVAQMGARRVLQTAFSDIDTYIRFMRVAHLLDSPTRMLAPTTLAKIARGGNAATPYADDAPGIGVA